MARPKKILLIRFSSLGDVVLTTATFGPLRERFPDAEIYLLTKSRYAALFERDPRLSGVLKWESGVPFHKQLSALRRMKFDLCVDLHANLRSRLVGGLLPARCIRYRKRRLARMAMVHLKRLPVRARTVLDLYGSALSPLGIEKGTDRPRLFLEDDLTSKVERELEGWGIREEDEVVGVHPGAKWDAKRWEVKGFVRVCDQILESGRKCLLLGDEEDLPFVQEIVSRMRHVPTLLVGELELCELAAVIRRCKLLVCNDSGPMHIATAVDTPVVAIFGPTHPRLGFAPMGAHDVVLTANRPCSPCSLHGEKACKYARRGCMEEISPDRVIAEIVRLASSPSPTSAPQ
ncbi:MAG: glycosyltransferase family 9 protein [Candidatus Latescibacteria bacterium]|nr:glycosyltransferase family 9 protein [Candidatus Latescibacterota bacterium]